MNGRDRQFLELYNRLRLGNQLEFYQNRRAEFRAAHRQGVMLTGFLMMLASIASGLAAANAWPAKEFWALAAVILPALGTALASYSSHWNFDRLGKLYGDAASALQRAHALGPDPAEPDAPSVAALRAHVGQVETILQNELGQWGQLSRAPKPAEPPRPAPNGPDAAAPNG